LFACRQPLKTIHDKDDALAKAFINKQEKQTADQNSAAKQALSFISRYTIAYFCGKINHLAIITTKPRLPAKI
jgi:hypothetical protein